MSLAGAYGERSRQGLQNAHKGLCQERPRRRRRAKTSLPALGKAAVGCALVRGVAWRRLESPQQQLVDARVCIALRSASLSCGRLRLRRLRLLAEG